MSGFGRWKYGHPVLALALALASGCGLPPDPELEAQLGRLLSADATDDELTQDDLDEAERRSSGPYILTGTYPSRTRQARARWHSGIGRPDERPPRNRRGLLLSKRVPTAQPVAAFGYVEGFAPTPAAQLTLGFDYSERGHCGAGAPRFNVYTDDGQVHFLGCIYGRHERTEDPGWSHVTYRMTDARPPIRPDQQVVRLRIAFDEGPDQGEGFAILDNIDIGGDRIGDRRPR